MSAERELLSEMITSYRGEDFDMYYLIERAEQLLAQPEQEQEPVAWITEWVQRYRYDSTPIMDRAVSFTKSGAGVPNPSYIPLYTSPPKREPLSEATIEYYLERLGSDFKWEEGFRSGVEWAEKAHGIGE